MATDRQKKTTELPLWRSNGMAQPSTHARAFWGSTIMFVLAFLVWFAMKPLPLEIVYNMGLCENQVYPPIKNPKRTAFLEYENVQTGKAYCRYGRFADGVSDCSPVPFEISHKPLCKSNRNRTNCATMEDLNPYDPSVLGKCVCTGESKCTDVLVSAIVVRWRTELAAAAVLVLAGAISFMPNCWDAFVAKRMDCGIVGEVEIPSMTDYVVALNNPKVWIMALQYAASFGTEYTMSNQFVNHLRSRFHMTASDASAAAGVLGLMNLVARLVGGMASDVLRAQCGLRGRITAQFLALLSEGLLLFAFGFVDSRQPLYAVLCVLVSLSLFLQMSEGSMYGIVPVVNDHQLRVWSILVSVGGTVGGMIVGLCLYTPIEDNFLPFKAHGVYVIVWAFTNLFL